jgi:Reverse transcriptase (RNA-dependent DNA polymerase)
MPLSALPSLCSSMYGCAIWLMCFFIKKKDGSNRLVVDWRKIDKCVESDQGGLPRIEDLMDAVRLAKIMSVLDCKNGYNCVHIKEGCGWLTAFRTPFGFFEFTILHFRWKNTPAHFQCYMHHVLRPVLHISAENYINDTLSHGKDMKELIASDIQILRILRENKLYLNWKKCEVHKKEVTFLGVKVSIRKL